MRRFLEWLRRKPETIVVGVTGHRALAETEKLRRAVVAALDCIAQAYPGRRMIIASSLADGADRLVVEEAEKAYAAQLIAVLPCEAAEYAEELADKSAFYALLDSARSREVIAPRDPSRAGDGAGSRYEAAGHRIVEMSEVLIALSDGKVAQGKGGTGAVVEFARDRGMPIVVVRAGNRDPGTNDAHSLGVEQGRLEFESFPRRRPLKPPFIVRIGITAHHDPQAARDAPPSVVATIEAQLHAVREQARAILARGKNRALFSQRQPSFRVVTRAADGIEIVAAELALENGFELDLILPFSRQVYAAMFQPGTARERFERLVARARHVLELDGNEEQLRIDLQAEGSRERAFENFSLATRDAIGNARHAVLRHSDVLMAVLEPQEAERKSATEEIFQTAQTRSIVASEIAMPIGGTPEPEIPVRETIPDLAARLERVLLPLSGADVEWIGPPPKRRHAPGNGPRAHERERESTLEEFYAEKERRAGLGAIWDPVHRFVADGKLPWFAFLQRTPVDDWASHWDRVVSEKDSRPDRMPADPVDPLVHLCYAWSDLAARHFGNRTRSAFLVTSAAGALAVGAALIGIALEWDHHDHPMAGFDWIWSVAELALVVAVVSIVLRGDWKAWHPKWIDYRLIAEQMRAARLLTPLGCTWGDAVVPPHLRHGAVGQTWMHWYCRAWLRDFSLPDLRMTPEYVRLCRDLVVRVLRDQIGFHAATAGRMARMRDRFHTLGLSLFVLSGVVSIVHLEWHQSTFVFLSGFLPALGGAIAAMVSQGELDRIARRSCSMVDHLEDSVIAIEGLAVLDSTTLGKATDDVAAILVGETLDWRTMFAGQGIRLPG